MALRAGWTPFETRGKEEAKNWPVVISVPLSREALSVWEKVRGQDALLLADKKTAVVVSGEPVPVWIYEWIWLNRGREKAYAFLDWAANEDESASDVGAWLSENGYPSIGEMRRWLEDHAEEAEREFSAAKSRVGDPGDGISVFGASFGAGRE